MHPSPPPTYRRSFALFLNQLPDMSAPQPPKVLLQAVEDTIEIVQRLQREHGIQGNSLLNFCVSDGATMLATRYASNPGEDAASLYYAEGCSYERSPEGLEESGIASAAAAASDPGGSATAGSKSVQGGWDRRFLSLFLKKGRERGRGVVVVVW